MPADASAPAGPWERATMTAREDLESLYGRYLRACNEHDVPAMAEFYHPDITVNDAPMPPDVVSAQFPPLFAAFPDWRWAIRHVWTGADTIALHFTVTGTHRGTFMDVPATGRRVSITEFTVYQVMESKFVAVWDLSDTTELLRQLRSS
ncbi:ester cyclase [Mycobacterium sp. C3-094]